MATSFPFFTDDQVLADLSPALQRRIKMAVNDQLLASVPILQFGSTAFKNSILNMLQPAVVMPHDYVVIMGTSPRLSPISLYLSPLPPLRVGMESTAVQL